MPTDRQPTEQEMAREALGLIQRGYALAGRRNDVSLARAIEQHWSAAGFILKELGPCPGFWGEVLAAVRLLSNKPGLHTVWDYRGQWRVGDTKQRRISADDARVTTIHLTDGYSTEPAAILAALRAVVGAADA